MIAYLGFVFAKAAFLARRTGATIIPIFCFDAIKTPGCKLKPFRLLVRGANWLGDFILTIPTLRASQLDPIQALRYE